MAGDWIKVENVTPDKPEIVKMASVLGIDQDAVLGKLVRLWIWADCNSVDGNDVSVTDSFIDRLTFQNGFAIALRNVGWLTGKNGCLMLPNFDRHNGQTSKNRANTNRRVAKHRVLCNDDSVTNSLQKPLPETEKRREENICLSKRETERKGDGVAGDESTESSSLPRDTHISFGNFVGIPASCGDVVAYLEGMECALPMSSRRAVAEAWYEEMLAKGWMLGKSRCRNWHAALQRKVRFVLEDRAHGLARGGAKNASGFIPNDNANRGRSYEL